MNKSNSERGNALLIVLLVIVLLGGAAFLLMRKPAPTAPTTTQPTAMEQQPESLPTTAETATSESMQQGTKEFTVEGSTFKFAPNTMTVKKGDKVKITFKNMEGFHDLVIDEFNVRTKQIPANQSETIEFVADKAGKFEYYCSVGKHRQMGMVGTLTVEE